MTHRRPNMINENENNETEVPANAEVIIAVVTIAFKWVTSATAVAAGMLLANWIIS